MELMKLRHGALAPRGDFPNNKEGYDGANPTLGYSGSRFWWRGLLSWRSLPFVRWGPRHDIGDRYYRPSAEGLTGRAAPVPVRSARNEIEPRWAVRNVGSLNSRFKATTPVEAMD